MQERSNESTTKEVLQSLLLLKHTINTDSSDNSSSQAGQGSKLDDKMNDEDTRSLNSTDSGSTLSVSSSMVDDPPAYDCTSSKIARPNDKDILSGRGSGVNVHPGNVFFRDLINANKERYLNGTAPLKKLLVKSIVEAAAGNGHRFLKLDSKSVEWKTLTFQEASRKTAQALREKSLVQKKQQKKQRREELKNVALKRKLDNEQFSHDERHDERFNQTALPTMNVESQEHRSVSTSSSSCSTQMDMMQNCTSQLGHLPHHLHEESLSLSLRLNVLKEKHIAVKQLEEEIIREHRELMRDLLICSKNDVPTPRTDASYNLYINDNDYLQQSMKRRKIANSGVTM